MHASLARVGDSCQTAPPMRPWPRHVRNLLSAAGLCLLTISLRSLPPPPLPPPLLSRVHLRSEDERREMQDLQKLLGQASQKSPASCPARQKSLTRARVRSNASARRRRRRRRRQRCRNSSGCLGVSHSLPFQFTPGQASVNLRVPRRQGTHRVTLGRASDQKAEQERLAVALEDKAQEREQARRENAALVAQLSAEKDAV